jgi:pimeloyl-ACP methyl ester carboxylesterase
VKYCEGDLHLHYEIRGTGPSVLFMHGLTADRHQADRCLEGLSGHRVITVDLPGHGLSRLSARVGHHEQVGFAVYADLATGLLRSLGVSTAHIGGISMGAGVALRLAIDSPDFVSSLILVRPAWIDGPAQPHLGLIGDLGSWMASGGPTSALRHLVADQRFADVHAVAPSCAADLIQTTQRGHVVAAPEVLPSMVDDRPYESAVDLERCAVPALIISSDFDPLHPRSIADDLARSLAQAEPHVVSPRYLEPESHARETRALISSFLRRMGTPGPPPLLTSERSP